MLNFTPRQRNFNSIPTESLTRSSPKSGNSNQQSIRANLFAAANHQVFSPPHTNNNSFFAANLSNSKTGSLFDPNAFDPNALFDPNAFDPNALFDPNAFDPNALSNPNASFHTTYLTEEPQTEPLTANKRLGLSLNKAKSNKRTASEIRASSSSGHQSPEKVSSAKKQKVNLPTSSTILDNSFFLPPATNTGAANTLNLANKNNLSANLVSVPLPEGATYVGESQDGKLHGNGILTFLNGDMVVGDWKNGLRWNVQKISTTSNGTKFVRAIIKEGMYWSGQASITYENETKFVGNYKDGKRHGPGTYTYTDGTTYAGKFEHGLKHGQWIYIHKNKQQEIHQYNAGKFIRRTLLDTDIAHLIALNLHSSTGT